MPIDHLDDSVITTVVDLTEKAEVLSGLLGLPVSEVMRMQLVFIQSVLRAKKEGGASGFEDMLKNFKTGQIQ